MMKERYWKAGMLVAVVVACGTIGCNIFGNAGGGGGGSNDNGTPPPACAAAGEACTTTDDCCTDLECGADGLCAAPAPACAADGEACTTTDDCCTDLECGADGLCATPATVPAEFTNASAKNGGRLYDNWWEAAGLDAPTGADHPLYPADGAQAGTGSETWRCKECHGWDFLGADGVYGDPDSSHHTGIAGIASTTKSPQEIFDLLTDANDHAFGDLEDTVVWDLVKFVLEGTIDTSNFIDSNDQFTGNADNGKTLFDDGVAGNTACMICHGVDGTDIDFADEGETEFVGTVASDNPWEFLHKLRFGQPGAGLAEGMPQLFDVATDDQLSDLGAHAQTLPTE